MKGGELTSAGAPSRVPSAAGAETGAPHLQALAAFVVLFALLLLAMHDTVRDLLRLWSVDDGYYSYGYLILPISAALAWGRRQSLRATPLRQEPLAVLALLTAGLIWLVARAADIALVQHTALVLSICLLVVAVFGRTIAWRLAFPLAFLFLMVPIGGPLVPPLQVITTDLADLLLKIIGVPTFRSGVVIETSVGVFNVAEGCAGLQFLAASLAAGLLFGYLAFSSWRRQAALLAAVVLMPIVINGVRVAGLIAGIHWTEDPSIAGPDHLVYGWVLFIIAISAIFLVAGRYADWPRRSGTAGPSAPDTGSWRMRFLVPLAFGVIAAPAYAALILERPVDPRALPAAVDPSSLPLASSCAAPGVTRDDWTVRESEGLTRLVATIDCQGREVDLLLVFGENYGRETRLFFDARQWNSMGSWRQTAIRNLPVDAGGLPSTLHHRSLVSPDGDQRQVYSWFWMNGRFLAGEVELMLRGVAGRLIGRPPPFALIALSERAAASAGQGADLITWFVDNDLDKAVAEELETLAAPASLSNDPS